MQMQNELSPLICQYGVLVVDDSALQRSAAMALLRAMGIEQLWEAADGRAALELLRGLQPAPAVMLLDLEMQGMDGIETAQQLAQEENCPRLLIASSVEPSILNAVAGMAEALGLPLLGTLRKPLTRQSLALALAHFDSPPARGVAAVAAPQVEASALRQALDERQIVPYYQPKIRLVDGEVVGLEALARWRMPDGKLVPPVSFIEVAEKNGLIDALTLMIFDQVLKDLSYWYALGFNPTVAINISAPSLSDRGFGNAIMERVAAARVSPAAIMLEITESALVDDLATALGTLGRLRLKGFGLAIDDYGTGFSSMQQLSRLPFSELKLDGSFVRHSPEKWQLRTILEAALDMGKRLGLATVAEGVETEGELQLLRALGCEYAQGYLIAAPMPLTQLLPWLDGSRCRLRALCHRA